MRIAVISVHGCPCIQPGGTDAGGMNVYVDEVYERMARLGHEITVYSRVHVGAEKNISSGYDLVHVPVGATEIPKSEVVEILREFTGTVIEDTAQHRQSFEVLASHYWFSGVVACELAQEWSIPHITSFHTLAAIKKRVWPDEDEPEIRFVEEKRVAREADAVVTWTKGEAEFIQSEMGVPDQRITVVAPGVDTDRFRNVAKSKTSTDTNRVLYVGRLDALKGVDLLIDAFSLLVKRGLDVGLQIVGGGSADEFRSVLGRISELRIADRVKLPGVLPQSELVGIYSAATCIVAPSFHETFGLAILEAAACGTPAVAADVDGLRSIVIDGETGYLVGERDPETYADRIAELVEDKDVRTRMSDAARARAELLNWESAVSNLLQVYGRATSPRSAGATLR